MKIGFNVKKITSYIDNMLNDLDDYLTSIDTRVTTLEKNSDGDSDWLEITSSNGQEAEITRPFTEIRMLARVGSSGNNYCVTCNYDNNIFHNSTTGGNKYFVCGNPTANNYGCKFKYMIVDGKQYVCVDSCFDGGSYDASEFRAWIKPAPTGPQ